jgi:hypothetical protein
MIFVNLLVQGKSFRASQVLTIRPVKVMTWDLSKIPKMSN